MLVTRLKQSPMWRNVIFTMVLAAIPLPGQLLTGNLLGNIVDSSGAAVASATVEIRREQGGVARKVQVTAEGTFSISSLEPGLYGATVTAVGFGTQTRRGLDVSANRTLRADFQLAVSQSTETLTVAAEPGELQADRSETSYLITKAEVVNLPVGGQRNFQNLLRLVPGVTPPRAQNSLAGNPQGSLVMNVNGVAYAQNGNRIDGALNYFAALPHHAAFIPSAESIEAVNVVTNAFDAEQGLAGGAAINVTIRSGSNQFHGGVWELNSNNAWRARNFFNFNSRVPKSILNQYGYRLGGPVWKDKLFFYTDYEGVRQRDNATTLASVPVAALRTGDFSSTGTALYDPATGVAAGTGRLPYPANRIPSSQFAAASQQLTTLLPAPNLGGFTNNYFASGSLLFNRDTINTKINWFPAGGWSVFGRYSTFGSKVFDPPVLGAAGGNGITSVQPGNANGRSHSLVAGFNKTLSPSWIVDGYFGLTRQTTSGLNVDIDQNYGLDVLKIPGTNGPNPLEGGYPGFNVAGFTNFGNPSVSNPYQWEDNLFVWAGNTSVMRGKHNFRAGVEVTRAEINHYQPQGFAGGFTLRGTFMFNGGLTSLPGSVAPNLFNAWGDFLLGLSQSMGKTTQYTIPTTVVTYTYAGYVRDQWQLTRKITLNYGARYELYPYSHRGGPGLERYDSGTNQVLIGGVGQTPRDTGVTTGRGQIAPRAGVAWRASSKMVMRAGYGMSIDPYSYGVFLRNVYPTVLGAQFVGASQYQAAGSLVTGLPAVPRVDTSAGVISIPGNFATSTIGQDFNRGYIHSFNVTLESRLPFGFTGEAAYVGTRSIRQMVSVNVNAAGPGGGPTGRALAPKFGRVADTNQIVPLDNANYNSLQAGLNRALKGGTRWRASYTYSKAIASNDNSDSSLFYNWEPARALNRAVTGYDRTHNLQISGSLESPFDKGKNWGTNDVARTILGGWMLSTALSAYSGTAFTVTDSATLLNAPGNSQTADQVLPGVLLSKGVGLNASWFQPEAFGAVPGPRFGTSGRNTLRGPGAVNLDASLFRKIRLGERVEAQFRFEAFNVTNTPAFNNPNANINSVLRNADRTVRSLNGFSSVTSAQSTERQLRLGLRLSF